MKDLSLHILDIVENSLKAEARKIKIYINQNKQENKLILRIEDDGRGIDEKCIPYVFDPFFTTRTTRRVGLGLSLLKASAQRTGGDAFLQSSKEYGTIITAEFQMSHIDCPPIGNMEDTIVTLIMANHKVDYEYEHHYEQKKFFFNTSKIKEILQNLSITEVEVVLWMKEYIKDGLENLVKS